jgi:crotonobetainyl-CoA:carnitine CoA-transferase CaiB-like acyl-CoA transferase
MTSVIKGVRIVEVAEYRMASSAVTVLADWGAEVVKFGHASRGNGRKLAASPIQFNERPPKLAPTPEFSQHTEEVLLELGYAWERIEKFKSAGVIA